MFRCGKIVKKIGRYTNIQQYLKHVCFIIKSFESLNIFNIKMLETPFWVNKSAIRVSLIYK